MSINDWVDTANEAPLEFPGCLSKLLTWIWNLRISYPTHRIVLGDNDITAAFRLIKYNPNLVAMHSFRVNDKWFGAYTGQNFGDGTSPANFESMAIARKEHARWLFTHRPQACLLRAAEYVAKMQVPHEATPHEARQFSKANADDFNQGAFDSKGNRLPPPFDHQIDDCLFADVIPFIRLASAASIVALEDVSGTKHPHQPSVLSHEKLELMYGEQRLMLGHQVDTARMTVALHSRRRQKLIDFLTLETWTTRKSASLRDIARLHGLLVNAAEFSHWGKCQFYLIQQLLRETIRARYFAIKHYRLRQEATAGTHFAPPRNIPRDLTKRLDRIVSQDIARLIWQSRAEVPIDHRLHAVNRTILDHLQKNGRWEMPIGHVVRRAPALFAANDASEQGIGILIPGCNIFCFIPLSDDTVRRTKLAASNPAHVHINSLEFIGLMMAYVMATLCVAENPSAFPPLPILHDDSDSRVALGWMSKMSTASESGQSLLRIFGELRMDSPVGIDGSHLAGVDNIEPDLISRPCELYIPHLVLPSERTFTHHLLQICQKLPKLNSYRVFRPNPELLSLLHSNLSTAANWEERPLPPKMLGRFETVESISSGFSENSNCWTECSL
jgi:hypothetical protein